MWIDMALQYVCDGCPHPAPLSQEQLTVVGRLDPCHYCADCLKEYRAFEESEEQARLQAVTTFEQWRAGAIKALLAGPLKKLPDE